VNLKIYFVGSLCCKSASGGCETTEANDGETFVCNHSCKAGRPKRRSSRLVPRLWKYNNERNSIFDNPIFSLGSFQKQTGPDEGR